MRLDTHMMRTSYIACMAPLNFTTTIIAPTFISVCTIIPNSVPDFSVWWYMNTHCRAYTFGVCRGIPLDRSC